MTEEQAVHRRQFLGAVTWAIGALLGAGMGIPAVAYIIGPALRRQETQIGAQIAMYRARVDSAPRVEQQMATLQREYDLEKQQYGELTARKRTAEIAENVERSRGSEQFTVLARAPFPTEPDNPKPVRLWTVVLLAGLVLGGGLALGREYLDRSIHDARALNDLDLPVLGEIPRIGHLA